MNPVSEFINSGILELYALGAASPEEVRTVERMAFAHPEVRQEIEQISEAIAQYAQSCAVKPRDSVKAILMATIDYLERMKAGELPESPPILTSDSHIGDFEKWLNKEDAVLQADTANVYARIIGYTPTATTAIIWIRGQSDKEVHRDEHERFLIVEGTCEIAIGNTLTALTAGDYCAIPLHTPHQLTVTSKVPCKAILQRISTV